MKKLLFAVAAVGFILVLQPADPVQADGGHKVTICHFGGHVGDFVTFNSEATGTGACDNMGGNAITVAQPACENGHQAAKIFTNRSCADGNLQP